MDLPEFSFPDTLEVPIKLDSCPLIEVAAELRYEPQKPDFDLGVLAAKIQEHYPDITKLPITQLPPQYVEADPNLRVAPHYSFTKKETAIKVQVGPRGCGVICAETYPGWQKFSDELRKVLDIVNDAKVVKTPTRLGLRYINFLEGKNIYAEGTLDFRIATTSLSNTKINFRADTTHKGKNVALMITNDAKVKTKNGSVVDIDVSCVPESMDLIAHFNQEHTIEKYFFFNIVKGPILEVLKPVWK